MEARRLSDVCGVRSQGNDQNDHRESMLQIISHTGLFRHHCVSVRVCVCECECVNTVVREEEEVVCNNRKGGWCGRYCTYVSLCVQIGKFPLQPLTGTVVSVHWWAHLSPSHTHTVFYLLDLLPRD